MTHAFRFTPAACLLAIVAGTSTLTSPPAYAAPAFQMPFPCGQAWVSNIWSGHSPALATDLNRGAGPESDNGATVVASAAGTVRSSYYSTSTGYGNYIVIDHNNGWTTHYAHLKVRSVAAGTPVAAGQKIGTVGNTSAKYNIASHLHYEQRLNNVVKRPVWNGVTVAYGKQTYTSRNACGGGTGGFAAKVNTNGTPLNVRSGPSTSYAIVGSRADGANVTIYCQKSGQSITGTYGTSSLWNKISNTANQFIPDAYTYTGSDGRVAPNC